MRESLYSVCVLCSPAVLEDFLGTSAPALTAIRLDSCHVATGSVLGMSLARDYSVGGYGTVNTCLQFVSHSFLVNFILSTFMLDMEIERP